MFVFVSCSIVTIFVESTLANHLLVRVQLKNSVTGLRPADSKEPELFWWRLKEPVPSAAVKYQDICCAMSRMVGFPANVSGVLCRGHSLSLLLWQRVL